MLPPNHWLRCRTMVSELITALISVTTVRSSSCERWALPITLRKQRFVDLTILSKTPPHHSARSTLNTHSQLSSARYSLTVSSWKIVVLENSLHIILGCCFKRFSVVGQEFLGSLLDANFLGILTLTGLKRSPNVQLELLST